MGNYPEIPDRSSRSLPVFGKPTRDESVNCGDTLTYALPGGELQEVRVVATLPTKDD